jgi:hypothetical protein
MDGELERESIMGMESIPNSEGCRKPIPKVHNVTSGKKHGATFSTIDGKKVSVAIGVNYSMQKMSVIFKLIIHPLFQIIRCNHTLATSTPVRVNTIYYLFVKEILFVKKEREKRERKDKP